MISQVYDGITVEQARRHAKSSVRHGHRKHMNPFRKCPVLSQAWLEAYDQAEPRYQFLQWKDYIPVKQRGRK